MNVFLEPSAFAKIHRALAPLGVDDQVDRAAVERGGRCRLWWGRTPLDPFFAYDEIHEAMRHLDRVIASLAERLPGLGRDVAIDGSDLPAYANGQRYRGVSAREHMGQGIAPASAHSP
jgi:hypothetical protein